MPDATAAAVAAVPAAPPPTTRPGAWHNGSSFGFRDLIDIVNPLQHLPVISSIYRWLTGDRPGEAAELAGNALYGGPIGVAVSLFSAATEDSQGRDLGEQVLAKMFGSDSKTTATAAATPAPAAAATTTVSTAAPAQAAESPSALSTLTSYPTPGQATRPPMPLFGGVALPPPTAAAPPQDNAARELINHNAATERAIGAGARAAPPRTAPVPLVLPAGTLPPARVTPAPAPPAVPSTIPMSNAAPNSATPVDVSQKMLDALDKYMRLEQDRKAKTGSADQPATAGVDMTM